MTLQSVLDNTAITHNHPQLPTITQKMMHSHPQLATITHDHPLLYIIIHVIHIYISPTVTQVMMHNHTQSPKIANNHTRCCITNKNHPILSRINQKMIRNHPIISHNFQVCSTCGFLCKHNSF